MVVVAMAMRRRRQQRNECKFLEENVDFAKEMVKKFYRKHVRFDAVQTSACMVYAQINQFKLKKLSRMMRFLSGGMYFFASQDSIANLKASWWDGRYLTLEYPTVTMQRIVRHKGGTITRDVDVSVSRVRPFEHVLLSAQDLKNTDRWVPGNQRFKTPWNVHDGFHDTSLVKFQIDAGGGSTKMILNLINVKNPQGQEHVCIFCEFSGGVKDTYHNVKVAAFQENSKIRSDMEAIAQRRVVILQVRLQTSQDVTMSQVIIASNTDVNHDIHSPQPLPIIDGTTITRAESITDEHRMGIVALDFSSVASVRVLHGTGDDKNTVLGLSFFDANDDCIVSSFDELTVLLES